MTKQTKTIVQQAVEDEVGRKVSIIETLRDPKVSTTYAVRTVKDGCFLVQVFQEEAEVIDTFELEDDQPTLKSLKSGSPRFY